MNLEIELGLAEPPAGYAIPRDIAEAQKAVAAASVVAERQQTSELQKAFDQDLFLDAFKDLGTIRAAALKVGVSNTIVRAWRKDPAFAAKFDDANTQYTEKLERIVFDRAESGKSDILLMFALKKRDPAYRENFKMEHSGEVAIRVIRYDEPQAPVPALPKPPAQNIIEAQVAS